MTRKNKLPSKLTFTRDYIAGLGPYLNSRGYSVSFNNIQGYDMRDRVERLEEDEAMFVWSGPYRRFTADKWKPHPRVIHCERGFLPHYTSVNFDVAGHGYRSSITGAKFDTPLYLTQLNELKEFLRDHYYPATIPDPREFPFPDPFYLLPLQHNDDSVMQYDAPMYTRNSASLIRQIAKVLPDGCSLVVKTHPLHTSPTLPGAVESSGLNVQLIDSSKFDDEQNHKVNLALLYRAKAMITVNSSFIFEALAFNVPTITLGRGVFSGSGLTKEVTRIDATLFDNIPLHLSRNLAFLYELCINRQILHADFDNREIVDRAWQLFENRYAEYWGME